MRRQTDLGLGTRRTQSPTALTTGGRYRAKDLPPETASPVPSNTGQQPASVVPVTRNHSSSFPSAVIEGGKSVAATFPNLLNPKNYKAAGQQFMDLASAARHPLETAKALAYSFDATMKIIDIPTTGKQVAGEAVGGTLALLATGMALSLPIKRIFRNSALGKRAALAYDSTKPFNSGVFQNPSVRKFLLDRPSAAAAGTLVGVGAFIGSALDRENAAIENEKNLPEVHAHLSKANLARLFSTTASSIRINSIEKMKQNGAVAI